jgi:hypothetical protein
LAPPPRWGRLHRPEREGGLCLPRPVTLSFSMGSSLRRSTKSVPRPSVCDLMGRKPRRPTVPGQPPMLMVINRPSPFDCPTSLTTGISQVSPLLPSRAAASV